MNTLTWASNYIPHTALHGRACVVGGVFLPWRAPGGSRMGRLVLPITHLRTPRIRVCQNLGPANHKAGWKHVGYNILHEGGWNKIAATMHVVRRDSQVLITWQDQERDVLVLVPCDQRKGGTSGVAGGGASPSSWAPALQIWHIGCPPTAYRNYVINKKLLQIRGVWIFPLWHILRAYYIIFACSLALACSFSAALVFLNYLLQISPAQ